MARESYKELYADVALVIIDIRLEGSIGGLTLSDMIRSINPNQPILHISGYTKPDDKRITHFLGKPFWINDFKLAVERAING
jgi:DNA-binding NtrC family response regulator